VTKGSAVLKRADNALLCAVCIAVASACSDATAPSLSLRIIPDTISLAPGEQVQLRLVLRSGDAFGRPLSPDRWRDNPFVRVGPDAIATGLKPGLGQVYADVHGEQIGAPVAVGTITYRNIDSAVTAFYDSSGWWWSAIPIRHPATVVDDHVIDSNVPRDPSLWTSTAYVGNTIYSFQVHPDGPIGHVVHGRVLRPCGLQRVLLLILDNGDTDIRQTLSEWVGAQDSVNGDFRSLARQLGYSAPLVRFENTNVLASARITNAPDNQDSAYAVLAGLGYNAASYDVVVTLVLTPEAQGGGAYTLAGNFVAMGCVSCPSAPPGQPLHLTRSILDGLARVLYHHEIGHLWGWRHEWGGGPEGTRIITNPVLFGWTDTDGDGIPEILDPTPYGITDTAGLGIGASLRRIGRAAALRHGQR
jgi:hypothetical protein